MRRACLAFLAFVLLSPACAAERPALGEGAAREVRPVDSAAADAVDRGSQESAPLAVRLAVPEGWSIDPADAGAASLTNRVVADLLYEGLTALAPDGSPVPALADRWFVTDDRLTWTFVLADDLTDGHGQPLTARDVKMSLERVAARGGADQAATALTVVAGWVDFMRGDAGGVAGISAPDETTVVIRLASPYELLLEVLASPAFGITGPDGAQLRTTGAFRATGDSAIFEAVVADSAVDRVELVTHPDGPASAVAAGEADWAVLATGEGAGGLAADIVRQPLELEVAIVARSPSEEVRLGLLGALQPLLLATTIDGLVARSVSAMPEAPPPPGVALIDIPTGELDSLGAELVAQLEASGVEVVAAPLEPGEFAARVASGDALLFPIVIAGGTGPASALLRSAVPGGSDDVFGPESVERAELADAVATEFDTQQRVLFAAALEQVLIDDGLLLPVGQFEVRVALAHTLDGLFHRPDGTLDLSDVTLADG